MTWLCIEHDLLNVVALIQYFSLSHQVQSLFFKWNSVMIISNLCLSCLCFKKETCWLLADSKWIVWIFVGFFKPKRFHVDLIYVSSKTFLLVEGLSLFSVNGSLQIIIPYLSKETYIFTCNLILFRKQRLISRDLGLLEIPRQSCSLLRSTHPTSFPDNKNKLVAYRAEQSVSWKWACL